MSPDARHGSLLYVAGSDLSSLVVYVFSYPGGRPVGKIVHAVSGLCTDTKGDVFMTRSWYSASRILEYAHGGTKPIAQLSDPYTGVAGCAVDPSSGNLAVEHSEDGTTLVYAQARGKPKAFHNFLLAAKYAAYDSNGNLFTFGAMRRVRVFELAKNAKTFAAIRVAQRIDSTMGIQWLGKTMLLGDGDPYSYGVSIIYRFTVKDRKAIGDGETSVGSSSVAFFVHNNTIAASNDYEVNIYPYPGGGSPISTIPNIDAANSLTVSDAP